MFSPNHIEQPDALDELVGQLSESGSFPDFTRIEALAIQCNGELEDSKYNPNRTLAIFKDESDAREFVSKLQQDRLQGSLKASVHKGSSGRVAVFLDLPGEPTDAFYSARNTASKD